MKLVLMSDTHTMHDRIYVPDGDVLVHAGDFSGRGSEEEARRFADWFNRQPHRWKVVIAGNHDVALEKDPTLGPRLFGDAYLCDSEVEIEGLRFYGAPWQPEFCNWAFNVERGPAIAEKWALIPAGIDVLVTHGPPAGIGDRCSGGHVGCYDLAAAVSRVKPRMHVFGHIHEGYGTYQQGGIQFVNASVCTGRYEPVNAAWVVELGAVVREVSNG